MNATSVFFLFLCKESQTLVLISLLGTGVNYVSSCWCLLIASLERGSGPCISLLHELIFLPAEPPLPQVQAPALSPIHFFSFLLCLSQLCQILACLPTNHLQGWQQESKGRTSSLFHHLPSFSASQVWPGLRWNWRGEGFNNVCIGLTKPFQ